MTQPNRDTHVDSEVVSAIGDRRAELGDQSPRFALFLFDCSDPDAIRKTIERIPECVDEWLSEVVVMLDHATLDPPHPAGLESLLTSRGLELRFHRPPRDSGYGAARKAAFEYTLLKHLDFAIVMRGDSSHPPERLPDLIHAALLDPPHLLIVSRRQPARTGSLRGLAHRFSTFFQNRSLGLRLNDYHASFRLYPAEALARIPFQLDSDETTFDSEIILQFRALGVPIREEPLLDARRGDGGGSDHVGHSLASCMTAIGYRLHQIHATRDGRYIVDHDVHYTLKLSDSGSHMQIVSAIRPDSRVLDLGCSQGLLARPLQEKNARVTGVDSGPGERFARELHEYYQRDLEKPLEIPVDRIFDYVVCADVIEHLQNRTQLLRSARRYLKQDGRLIISTPNIALWFYRLSLLVGRFEYGPRGVLDETHVHLFTGATLRRGVEKAGFQIVGQRVTALPFEVVFESTGRSRLVQHLAAAYHWLARLWPSMFAYQYILEAEITTLDEESTELRQPHATDVP